ncbi:TRAPP subunit [Malassezia arunalokei]|uniref:TRAPP subunit n=1 Tax=Malassezia arunalokei TaxID=1514897 RepID=A0AAJ5Z8A1_9BASI|nr:TRAPP subunit [Malassezia arunalokei]
MSYYFCIVGTRDNLLYEADLSPPSTTSAGGAPETESHRTSSVFGFTNALGQWTGGIPLLPTADPSDEVKKEESKFTSASSTTHERHLLQMIAHGSLDSLEDRQFLESNIYFKNLDRIYDWNVSVFLVPCSTCTPAHLDIKFILLHQHKHEEGIRLFLMDVWELWVKIFMNPFQDLDAPIQSTSFDTRIRASAKRHL